jgi:hypothetical protein
MWKRFWYFLIDGLKIRHKEYKKVLNYFYFYLILGAICGIIIIYANEIGGEDINRNFVDQNIINSASVNSTFGGYIGQRLLGLFLPLTLLFILGILSGWTAMAVYPFMFLQGYWFIMTVWWTVYEYTLGAIILLAFYIVWLLIVLAVLIFAVLWIMKITQNIRCFGFRAGFCWIELWRGLGVILATMLIISFVEYLVYWVLLSRIIY